MTFNIKINRFKRHSKIVIEQGLDRVADSLQRDLQQESSGEKSEISKAWRVDHSSGRRRVVNNHAAILDLEYGTEIRAGVGLRRSTLAAFHLQKRRRK